ncbi:Nucleotid_trans domain-containing protein [Cephalotus follicularis]|uniref:Nucleotid_trans domain-containing protein n=1 Tax=Cephalotus follicularis TaxID=3775 RepID=A0A1Q3B925_CEPFO|nr:Nucleotid_trans domain-containing protein [Cephalotus follicularis]
MVDGMVILTIVNHALARPDSTLDLFLESFRIGERTQHLLNHLVIFAVDNQAFQYCNSKHHHCFFLSNHRTMKSLSWRNKILQLVLQLGYDFIFTNADVMWLRNPVSEIDPVKDMTIACNFTSGDSQSTDSKADGEFFYLKSDTPTIEYLKYLKMVEVLYPRIKNQSLCEVVKSIDIYDLRIKVLGKPHFGEFCESSWDMSKIYTIYANCCDNIDSQVHDLKLLLDNWRNFKEQSGKNTALRGLLLTRSALNKCKG